MLKVISESGFLISDKIINCNTFLKRFMGLMMRKSLNGFDGALITPCNSIHSFFMRMSIDCYFLDKDNRIVKIIKDFKPWRLCWIVREAQSVLELPAGYLKENTLSVGDRLSIYAQNKVSSS